ncbi:MAG: hypothetical protein WBX25_03345 [Rhodomicrobium sp.]
MKLRSRFTSENQGKPWAGTKNRLDKVIELIVEIGACSGQEQSIGRMEREDLHFVIGFMLKHDPD